MNGPAPADRLLITEMLARYAEAVDAGDFDGVGKLLEHATILDAHGRTVAAGRAAIVALYRSTTRLHADGTPRTAHVITNVIIDADGPSRAEVRSRFTVFQATETVALQPVVAGRYLDRVERVGSAWRFTSRMMIPEAWGDVGDHLTFDPRG